PVNSYRKNPMILRNQSEASSAYDADGATSDSAGRGDIRATWRRVREEYRAIHENDERLLMKLLAAIHVVWRLLPMYLVLLLVVLAVHLVFFDNLGRTIRIYGGPGHSKTGQVAKELAQALNDDFNRQAAFYRWPKHFESDADLPDATRTSAARLGKLHHAPT